MKKLISFFIVSTLFSYGSFAAESNKEVFTINRASRLTSPHFFPESIKIVNFKVNFYESTIDFVLEIDFKNTGYCAQNEFKEVVYTANSGLFLSEGLNIKILNNTTGCHDQSVPEWMLKKTLQLKVHEHLFENTAFNKKHNLSPVFGLPDKITISADKLYQFSLHYNSNQISALANEKKDEFVEVSIEVQSEK